LVVARLWGGTGAGGHGKPKGHDHAAKQMIVTEQIHQPVQFHPIPAQTYPIVLAAAYPVSVT